MSVWHFTLPFIITTTAIIWMLRLGSLPLDVPNDRSLHDAATPRVGGLAIIGGAAVGWVVGGIGGQWLVLYASVVLSVFYLLDDMRGLPIVARFIVQLGVGGIALYWEPLIPGGLIYWIFFLIIIVWGMNLFNFMDGANGLAGGMAFIGFSFIAFGAWFAGANDYLGVSLSVSSSALAFLCFNFGTAKIFMGDAGSIPLGFLASLISIKGYLSGVWSWVFPLLVFAPFIADSTVTLVKRLIRGEKIWMAHREHYYQRLVRIGLGHTVTALIFYLFMIMCGLLAMLERNKSMAIQAVVFVCISGSFFCMMAWFDIKWKKSGLPR